MAGTLRGNNIHGGTFQFSSHYPNLHMPAYQVDDSTLVDPGNTACLLDGELVFIGEASGITGSVRASALTAANFPTVSDEGGGVFTVQAPATATDNGTQVRIKHGRRGRGDSQFFGAVPVVMDYNFEFKYRLIDDGGTYAPGTKLYPVVIANADLPSYVQALTTRDVVGLAPAAEAFPSANAGQNVEHVAVCRSSKDEYGWIKAVWRPGVSLTP